MEAIDLNYCKISPYKCDQVGCEHNKKIQSYLFSKKRQQSDHSWLKQREEEHEVRWKL